MSDSHFNNGVPRGALLGAAALIALTLGSIGASRLAGVTTSPLPDAPAVASRDLRFDDAVNGAIAIRDAATQQQIATVQPGNGGFVRGALRGLARDRKRDGLGSDIAFRLSRLADGRLTLRDLATGEQIDLEAFGHTNASVFAEFLTAKGAS
ncbi:MAG: phosphonate-binding protein [Alphaproteobacteria bacterium]|nr:phosphonate-binding protein [Alphaproteobacteria bacterium]